MQLDRSQGIGCSDLAAIMDVSPWSNPYKLWEEKVYGTSVQLDSPAMKYGRETEPLIRKMVEKKLGMELPAVRIIHPERPWLWASLDGYNAEKGIIAEFKTANKEDHLLAISGKVPEKYWPQVQGQMEVVGVDKLYYCSYHEEHLEILKLHKDHDHCKIMMEKAEAFWECVVLETSPGGYISMKEDKRWNDIAEELYAVKEQIKALEKQEKELMQKLKDTAKGKNAIGCNYSLQKQDRDGCIDYKRAIEDYIANLKIQYPEISLGQIDYQAHRKKSFEKWKLQPINKNGR